ATVGGSTVTTTTAGDSNVTIGSTTITLSATIGSVIGTGENLNLTSTATDGSAISFTVGYLRS
ncbi:MAG: hypothetical protein AAF959_29420, partial [Cyanobacteria bacterium P01_D01_bin.56]